VSRWKPKAWLRPRSRRARNARFPSPRTDVIIKALWPQSKLGMRPTREMVRPVWVEIARKFGWMTPNEYWTHPEEWTGRMLPASPLWAEAPLFGLFRKVQP